MVDIPLGLRHAIESGECILFLGAGIGDHLLDDHGEGAPIASALAEEIALKFSIETDNMSDLEKISSVVELRRGRLELETFIRSRLADRVPDESLQWLFTRKWKAIFTTNYDNCIERAYQLLKDPPQIPISINSSSDIVTIDHRFEVPIYHLHGSLFGLDKPNIIITEDDYIKYSDRRQMLFELLKNNFATSTFLYIGYSNQDQNWKRLLAETLEEFYPSKIPNSYRISPRTNSLDIDILRSRGIETINATYKEFYQSISSLLSKEIIDQDKLLKIKEGIPSELIEAFDKNTAATIRMLSSWIYVNQVPFNEDSNLHSFLRGDRPNWGVIGKREIFERDIEEDIYNELLDFATNNGAKTSTIALLGPAGYGVTTLLMTLAARLVSEKAGKVFMLKPEQHFLEGDAEFAISIFPEKTFFFVDTASDYAVAINTITQKFKESNKTAMFILGERLNEWRQNYKKPYAKEFELGPLSDTEINRLLDYLGNNSELNALEPLSRDLQFSTIKTKHKQDLLVVLREATEGKSFDAILEDEYRGITDPLARQLYSVVCCFYQHGVYLRDDLLARLLNTQLTKVYEETTKSTEGVVFYDCTNEEKQQFAVRARHRIIAAVVWERCLSIAERDSLIQSSLSSLNLNYGLDKAAFEAFTRSDRVVDGISTLDAKIKFFESAARKDPDSPYVRQHYARMLLRENHPDLALAQIEIALKINPNALILHHTKGLILMELALTTESIDIARRRLVQSEASFRHAIKIYSKDEYAYQGLAQLYIGWAKRSLSSEESTDYITKAEEIITEGLKVARAKDGLWIESARIQEWLGHEPSQINSLETAVMNNPGSIVARYLLGRSYRKAGRVADAVNILEPTIKNHHDEFRSFVEYAIALAIVKKSYRESIAILQLSTLYGLSDPRYIATLAGMLFMEKKFSEATQISGLSTKKNFSALELNSVQFRPFNFENLHEPLKFNGTVASVRAGYSFIETQDYPNFLCPSSKYGGVIMEKGLQVVFEPGFSPKGAIAEKPRKR